MTHASALTHTHTHTHTHILDEARNDKSVMALIVYMCHFSLPRKIKVKIRLFSINFANDSGVKGHNGRKRQYIYVCIYMYVYAYPIGSVSLNLTSLVNGGKKLGFPGGSVVKDLPANAGDAVDTNLIPVLGSFPGGGNFNPFQYSCLGNAKDRGAWPATVHGIANSQTQPSD